MKKVIFLVAVITVYFISCTSSKENLMSTTDKEDYYKDPFVKKYKDEAGFISPDLALKYIQAFRKHKYRVLDKARLINAWSRFDSHLLHKIEKDNDVDSVYFLLAAYPKTHDIEKEMRGHPFVIMEAVPKLPQERTGKGSANFLFTTSHSVFFIPLNICPPPNGECIVPASS